MAAKGTRLALTSLVSMAGRKFIPWQDFIGGQTTGAATTLTALSTGTPISVAVIGKSGAEFGLSGLGLTNSDTFAVYLGDIYDFDLTKAIYIDYHVYVDHASTAGKVVNWVTTALWCPSRPAAANYLGNDNALIKTSGTASDTLTTAATDLAGIVIQAGATFAASVWTDNTGGLVINGACTTDETTHLNALVGIGIRYTRRVV
jgi:hypothetical protein